MEWIRFHFIGEPVEVVFDQPPLLEKKPHRPDGFIWRGETFHILQTVAEWQDFQRRGRMARNMQPQHAARARRIGSWGVGRYYFRVLATEGRTFDLYYDRAPHSPDQRKGIWILKGEVKTACQ